MICERCGNDMLENTTICPVCGALTAKARAKLEPATNYGTYTPEVPAEPAPYEQNYERGYAAQATPPSPRRDYSYPPPPRPQQPAYGQPPRNNYMPPFYHYAAYPHVTVVNTGTGKNEGALIAEILFSLFGIFGIGWLIGGETTIGIVLLICSFLLYWPIILGGTIITFGLGLLCLGPIAIGAIILNALLLHNRLKRKVSQFYMMPPPPQPMHMPPHS